MSLPIVTNCPNCGAPIDSDKCPYCGTRLINIADLEAGETVWFIFRDGYHDNIVTAKRILVRSINVSYSQDSLSCTYLADNRPYAIVNPSMDVDINIEGTLCKNDKGFFGVRLDKDEAEDPDIRHYI